MKSRRISEQEWQQILRLLAECRELGDDLNQWRGHLLAGLARLVDADLILHAGIRDIDRPQSSMCEGVAWGFENFNLQRWIDILAEYGMAPRSESLALAKARLAAVGSGGITASRCEMFADRNWDRSFDNQVIARTIGTDALMQSLFWVTGNSEIVDGLTLSRGAGRRQFNEREVKIVSWIHAEVARQIGGQLAGYSEKSPSDLPLRVRQVLQCVLEGDSDKQIAKRLGISAHTVNQYTKAIYQFFQVNGRTELLARWIRRGWSVNPHTWNAPEPALIKPYTQ